MSELTIVVSSALDRTELIVPIESAAARSYIFLFKFRLECSSSIFFSLFFDLSGVIYAIDRMYMMAEYELKNELKSSHTASLKPPIFPITSKKVTSDLLCKYF